MIASSKYSMWILIFFTEYARKEKRWFEGGNNLPVEKMAITFTVPHLIFAEGIQDQFRNCFLVSTVTFKCYR